MIGSNRIEVGAGTSREPLHLMALRLPVYAGAAALAVGPIAPGAGLMASLIGVTIGLVAGRFLAGSKLRSVAIVAAAIALAGLGLAADRLVGGPSWIAGLLGYRGVLTLVEILTFGLIPLAMVASARALTTRHPSLGGIEAAAVAAIVVATFAGHRDLHLGRPQFFSDWALSRGNDPVRLLMGLGVATTLACVLLLLRPEKPGKTIVSVLALFSLTAILLGIGSRMFPEPRPDYTISPEDQPKPKEKQKDHEKKNKDDKDDDPPPSPQPIAIVNFLDDLKTKPGFFYFRGKVQSGVSGNKLIEADTSYDGEFPRVQPSTRTTLSIGDFPADETLFEPVRQRISMIVDYPDTIGLVAARVIEPKPVADPNLFRRTFHVDSRVPIAPLSALAKRKAGDPMWSSEVRNHYLAAPADPRYKAKAESIVESGLRPEFRGSAALKALAISKWIEANTIYCLHPEPSADPAASFLFDGKPGKCTEIAHAMVFMLRGLGIPARAATGFASPGGRMGTGSALLVQQSDAHQWCEVYFEGVGWVVVDASPNRSLSKPAQQPDPATQSRYAEKNRAPEEEVVDKMRDDEESAKGLAWAPSAAESFALSMLVIGIGWFSIKLWRRQAIRWAPARSLDRVAYRAILDRLAEVGLTRRFGETRGEFAARVSGIVPDFVAATEAFDRRIMTGEGRLDRAAWMAIDARISGLLAEAFPASRRLVGLANPLSWRRSR